MNIKSQFELTKLITNTPPNLLGLTASEKLVLLYICHFMDAKFTCYPSVNKLVSICGLSKSTITRAIKTITKTGILIKTNRTTKQGNTSNLYQLNIATLNSKFDSDTITANTQKKHDSNQSNNKFLAENGKYYTCATDYHIEKINRYKNESN
ncbi:helix-turn-helix domain-containing protein [Photobacterium aquimaris]|uniref:Helix-turn-helix domain-containing protein n=1 Tax=Photobacterium aquimaris TaxID=512643 RepID=A0A2T3IMN8_9GAMM|nr:helix-turn-helix domain-containing protein [Photobacterium aquimaris]OBU14753.1 hypothetical protein AYY20_07745 [Photobacterium aquimaris]PSU29636.1 helix-turn-helix domain-containing protein [Photobacterium aquimaris]